METVLSIAIQKSGRLAEKSLALLKECGISITAGPGALKARASNFPLEVLFLRDDDIPKYVAERVADCGIVGENVVAELGDPATILEQLDFAKCRLSLAIRREERYEGPHYFEGKRIATSYPKILRAYLAKQGVQAEIEEISGSVEIAPGIGLAEGICDIVSTGSTLLQNGLREVEVVYKSEAVLIRAPRLDAEKDVLLERLRFRMRAVRTAARSKYILLNAPNTAIPEICALIPGMKSPTILPLAQEGWSSLHSVVPEDTFWEIIDRLKVLGAQGILVVPIEKMIL
jgi:ATP phosphoribosyltransferase